MRRSPARSTQRCCIKSTLRQSGVGTGGYVLENFDPGVRTSLKRNPNYWKEGRAHFDSAEVLAIIDIAARTNALTTGEIDVMDRVEAKTAHLLERNKNLRLEETSGTAHYTFAMLIGWSLPNAPRPRSTFCIMASRSSAYFSASRTSLLSNGGVSVRMANV